MLIFITLFITPIFWRAVEAFLAICKTKNQVRKIILPATLYTFLNDINILMLNPSNETSGMSWHSLTLEHFCRRTVVKRLPSCRRFPESKLLTFSKPDSYYFSGRKNKRPSILVAFVVHSF